MLNANGKKYDPEPDQSDLVNRVQLPTTVKPSEEYKEVPPRSVYGHDLKKLKSYKKIRQAYKQKNTKNVFLSDLRNILHEFSPDDSENELNDELLIEIMQIAEEYYIHPSKEEDREALKVDSVIELMLPYFRGDAKLLEYSMKHVKKYVKKIGKLHRTFLRAKLFFFPKKLNIKMK